MENHRVKTRMDAFPAGLRVLVVDDDPTWLRILENMLKKCSFEATACTLATDALDILRKRKDAFDIVISDVNMPDMDGFELLEQVGLEMNLPVIMMSVDGETSRVMKGVLQGACDYLLKPIRMKELQNIWQHVFRKKIHKVKDIEGNEDIQKIKNRLDVHVFDDSSHSLNGSDNNSARKRKGLEYQMLEDHDSFDSYAKKARVIWSVDLHQKFVDCVNQIGLDKIGPKKILDTMNVPWLTRENVASHLQKYRLYLSRLQNKNEPNSCFGAMKNPESNSKNSPPSFGLQSSIPQINSASCSFEYSGRKMPIQDVGPEVRDKDFISFMPSQEEPRKPVLNDPPHSQKMGTCSRMGHVNSFGSGIVSNQTSFESSIPQQVSWSEEIPVIQFRQQPNEEHKQHRTYTNVRLPSADRHVHADSLKLASSKKRDTTIAVIDKADPFEVKALCTEKRSNHDRLAGKIMHKFDSASGQAKTSIVDAEVSGAIPTVVNNNGFDQYCASNWHSQPQNHISGSGLNPASFRGDQQLLSLDGSFENAALSNLEFSDYFDSEFITELSSYLYDGVQLNSDFLNHFSILL